MHPMMYNIIRGVGGRHLTNTLLYALRNDVNYNSLATRHHKLLKLVSVVFEIILMPSLLNSAVNYIIVDRSTSAMIHFFSDQFL